LNTVRNHRVQGPCLHSGSWSPFSPQRAGFDVRAVHLGFLAKKSNIGTRFHISVVPSPIGVCPPMSQCCTFPLSVSVHQCSVLYLPLSVSVHQCLSVVPFPYRCLSINVSVLYLPLSVSVHQCLSVVPFPYRCLSTNVSCSCYFSTCHAIVPLLSFNTVQGHSKHNLYFISNC